MADEDFGDFARKFSGLFHEKPSESKSTPIYSELKDESARYSNANEIARGGMKSIKKVLDKATARNIALAEPLPKIDESLYEVFLKEARLTALLEHPNIISIHDIGLNEEGLPYFTMDLKTGDTLESIFRELLAGNEKYKNTYSLNSLLIIFSKICDAVSYAHSKNVIHLDLKPSNIQVGDYGEVLVCDWGLGKIINNPETEDIEELLLDADLLNHVASKNKVLGTPGYMAPEQVDKNGVHDQLTDIYSLGCILYSILTHQRPLNGETASILEKTKNGDIRPPVEVTSMPVPESLNAVICRAISLKKEERYQSVNELNKDIQKYLSGYSTEAENASFWKILKLFFHRNKVPSIITLIALILIVFLTVFFIGSLKKEINEKETERQKAEDLAFKLKQEKDNAEVLLKKSQDLVKTLNENYLENSKLMNDFVYDNPTIALEKTAENARELLRNEPDNKTAKKRLINSLFAMQKFEELNQIEINEKELKELKKLSNKYIHDIDSETLLMPVQKLAELIKSFRGVRRFAVAEQMIAYDQEKRKTKTDYFEVVRSLLTLRNPDWKYEGFEFDKAKRTLTISSPNLADLRSKPLVGSFRCVLRFLDFDNLVFTKDSSFKAISHLTGLKITSLDISQINIVLRFRHLRQLREVILSKDQHELLEEEYKNGSLKIVISQSAK